MGQLFQSAEGLRLDLILALMYELSTLGGPVCQYTGFGGTEYVRVTFG